MKSKSVASVSSVLTGLLVLMAGLVSPLASAQQIYRIVGPDGRVTFSDQQPMTASNATVNPASAGGTGGSASSALPFELRQVAAKYPVTIYTGENCSPCGSARSMLTSRGIPFTEKTVTTPADGQALQRLSGDTSLPFATIGGQQLKGFSDSEWSQFLDAAGYPKSSVLPGGYHQPPAVPMVVISTTPSGTPNPATAARSQATAPTAPPPAISEDNPAGIKF